MLNSKVVEFSRLQQGNMLVLEYVRQFDQFSQYALDIVSTDLSKICRFMSGLRLGLASLVNIERDSSESYADMVDRAIR